MIVAKTSTFQFRVPVAFQRSFKMKKQKKKLDLCIGKVSVNKSTKKFEKIRNDADSSMLWMGKSNFLV